MKLTLNLASRSYVNRRALYLFYTLLIGVLLLLLVFHLAWGWRLHAHSRQVAAQVEELDKQLGEVPDDTALVITPAAWERQATLVGFANVVLERDGFRWTALLDRLEEVASEGITIRSLQPDPKENSIKIAGQARSVQHLQEFLDQLMASSAFPETYLLQQATEKVKASGGSERPVIGFSLLLKGGI
ncbi:MAG: PilN domain-containing protein [Desulfuromonadales bacterium]|nr:PilN domain-containing protein [Desulfuromonadales bacterium]